MLVHTSIEGILIPGSSDGRRALLADFDIDGDEPKPKHKEWLRGLANIIIRSRLRPPEGIWVVAITGKASQTGSSDHNAKLSERRANKVREYLAARLAGVPVNWVPKALGETMPFDAAVDESVRDRSVEVAALPSLKVVPPPPPDRRKPGQGKTFDLVVTSFVVNVGPGVTHRFADWIINLDISDPTTDLSTSYFFEGSGSSAPMAGAPTPVGSGRSRSLGPGAIQPFIADRRLRHDGFAGDAAFSNPIAEPPLFRFGGLKLKIPALEAFPLATMRNFVLPKAAPSPPLWFAATGKLHLGSKRLDSVVVL